MTTYTLRAADEASMPGLLLTLGAFQTVETGPAPKPGIEYSAIGMAALQGAPTVLLPHWYGSLNLTEALFGPVESEALVLAMQPHLHTGQLLRQWSGGTVYSPGGGGMRRRIRQAAESRKLNGGFLPASGANPKWLAFDKLGIINAASALNAAIPAGASVVAMDGTNYTLTKVKSDACQLAAINQIVAIDAAAKTAIDAWVANPASFSFDAIAWPAQYVPA